MNNDSSIYIEDMMQKYNSAVEVKKELIKKYIFGLTKLIQMGAIFGDEEIESLKLECQNRLNILEDLIDEEQRENALDNMEILEEDDNSTNYTLDEITQDILDNNGAGSFSRF